MKVLVVHDRKEIGEQILGIVKEQCDQVAVELVDDASKARNRLASTFYDLLILDLTIPHVSPGNTSFEIVEGLLEELVTSGMLMVPGSVLGITQDEAALDAIQNNIGSHLMAIVSEDVDGLWRKHLSDRIQYVFRSSASQTRSLLTKHDFDVLIVTALDKEMAPYRKLFDLKNYAPIAGVYQFIFTDKDGIPRRGACYAIGRAGQPSAASETQGLLCQLRPRLAMMTGFCGGIPDKAALGKILFAESSLDWDYGKWKPFKQVAKLYARPEPVGIRNSKIHRIARNIVDEGIRDQEQLVTGLTYYSKGEINQTSFDLSPFASGSAVIGDTNVLANIKSLNDSVGGVDMESFGFYYACKYALAAQPEFICIKAVADDCGPEKDDRLHEACSFASASVAKTICTMYWDFT
jgi:nucleoside phosphorylase/CheY-like chemotaxis protein